MSISPLKPELDTRRRERRARAPRRVALHVDRDRIHRDMRRGELDVHGERRRIAAQPLRADTELVDRLRQLVLELRAFWIGAMRAERTRRRALRQCDAEIRRATDADADDGRWTGLRARRDHAVDDECP